MSRGRLRAALVVAGGAGTLLFGVAAPALAATQSAPAISAPSTVTNRSDVQISASISSPKGGTLTLSRGSTANSSASTTSATTISCTLDATAGGCGWSGTLANGTYTVTAINKGYTQTSSCGVVSACKTYDDAPSTATLVLKVPPAAPTHVDAALSDTRDVHVTWTPGSEPDMISYDLLDGAGNVLYPNIIASDADFCSASQCHIDVIYPDDDAGGQKDFKVRASRSDGDGGQLDSAASASTSVTLPAPPSPTTDGTGGGSGGTAGEGDSTGGGSTGGSGSTSGGATGGGSDGANGGGVVDTGSGGSTDGSGTPFKGYSGSPGLGLKFSTSGGDVTIPNLPGNPNPNVAIPEGTYDPKLGYKDQVAQDSVREKTLSTRFVTTLTAFTDGDRLWKSLAGALVLVMIGMHMRQWTRTASYE